MGRGDQHLVEVELVDDVGATDTADPPADAWRSPLAAVPRRVRVVAAGLVMLTGAGVGVARHLEETALTARLAEVDGLSAPLDRPLTEAWRAPGALVIAELDDVLILWPPAGDHALAVDPATGATRYTAPGMCHVADTGSPVGSDPRVPDGDSSDDVLVCDHHAGTGKGPPAGVQDITVHDPVTGELLRSIPSGWTYTWSPLAGDIVSLGMDADRHVTAGRWSLSTGEERWTYRSAEPSPTNAFDWSGGVGNDAMGVDVGDFSVTLDPDTGEEVDRDLWGDAYDDGSSGPMPGPGGVTVSYRYESDGTATTTVLGPDGEERFDVPGLVVGPDLDDGTATGMLFTAPHNGGSNSPRSLTAVDAISGETLWTADVPVTTVVALSGKVLVRDRSGTAALDPGTGEQLWAVDADRMDDFAWRVVTDGRRLLTVEPGAPRKDAVGRDRPVEELVARDLATGEVIWREAVPFEGQITTLEDGTVVLLGSSEMAALRP